MKRRHFIKKTAALGIGLGLGKAALAEQAKEAPEATPAAIPRGPSPRMSGRIQSEWRWLKPPYTVTKGIHLFADWRYVDPGYVEWRSADDRRISSPGSGNPAPTEAGPFIDAYANHSGVAQGIAIRAQPAKISEPLPGIMSGAVVYEEGRYRLWYSIWSDRVWYVPELAEKDPAEMLRIKNQWETLLLYAESRDGFDWKTPKLNLIDPKEYAVNGVEYGNAVFGGSRVTHKGVRAQTWKSPTVFVDPHAPSHERYKMAYGAGFGAQKGGSGGVAQRMFAAYRKRWPDEDLDPDPMNSLAERNSLLCLMGATSPDGLHWTTIPEPLALHRTDSNHVVCYDELIGKYVWYARRDWYPFERRSIGRAESNDFTHFSVPEMIIHPETDDDPGADWYTPAKTIYPGTLDQHLMFPTQFCRSDESGVIQLFSSLDGIHWNRVPGGPVITRGPAGHPSDSWLRYTSDLLPLPGGRVGIMLDEQLMPHKYPRRGGKRAQEAFGYSSFWAFWPKGRLAAVEADGHGSFSSNALKLEGRKLVLNLQTKTAGEVRVEVARRGQTKYSQGDPIPSRTFADCDPMHGDLPEQTVTWRGQSDLGFAVGEPIVLRFRMRMAKIFSFEVV